MTLFTHSLEFFISPKIARNCKIHRNPSWNKVQSFKPFRDDKGIFWSKVVVSCKVKDFGALDLNQNFGLYGQFSIPVKEESREEKEKQNYYVNMGYAIRTLREDFPQLFCREPKFDIYRDDIVFKDPLNTFMGIKNYKSIFWVLRFQGRIFFKALWIDLISVWQPAENVIMVRWTVHGIPRVPWESRGRFDGTSEYKLDKEGKIFEHRVDNIAMNKPPKFYVLSVEELLNYIGCSSTPRPTYFEISSSTKRT
ncbi:hypothetical protein Lal_00017170 [Lupinus albus]|uniref:Putative NTF2-like domain-containing protein n=1 Tax=Lupinus albus TaxID=3870 RepID=A0A6A4QR85_LUPAL|nr:putative NTF2-like domain-containing protein [Lupinus albus]KAF1869595.1 hypothetical protein Lal_00017170 [Lupinus albus]